jgi:diphthine-ammonia ligase
MRLIALFSGGKDSLYAAIYAQFVLGHEVVAGVNLYPSGPVDGSSETLRSVAGEWSGEVDSAMLQSVGAHVVGAAYPHCLPTSIRWYRRAFQKLEFAANNTLRYRSMKPSAGPREATDEVMALDLVIEEILADFSAHGWTQPHGLVSGAILSDYQRLRVEYVASRHHLVSLAPLWRRNGAVLLDSMLSMGIDAILVKVAALGLEKHHLGRSLDALRGHLQQLEQKYGIHCLGEGGEYESLVLDCPWFRQRLVLDASSIVDHGAGSAYLQVDRFHWEPKPEASYATELERLRNWATNEQAQLLHEFPGQLTGVVPAVSPPALPQQSFSVAFSEANAGAQHTYLIRFQERFWRLTDNHAFYFCNIWAEIANPPSAAATGQRPSAEALKQAGAQMEQIVDHLRQNWPANDCLPFLCMLYLTDMSLFRGVNTVYARLFSSNEQAPPARCCIQLPALPHPTSLVQLEIFAESSKLHQQSIHVQSLSLWAPACIGPYSQGRVQHAGMTLYLSGVIALFPASGEIPSGLGIEDQLQICLWNARRIVQAFQNSEPGSIWCCRYCIAWYEAPDRHAGETRGHYIHKALGRYLSNAEHFILGVPALPRGALVELQLAFERENVCVDSTNFQQMPEILHEFIDVDKEQVEQRMSTVSEPSKASFSVQIPVMLPSSVYGISGTRLRCLLPMSRLSSSLSSL